MDKKSNYNIISDRIERIDNMLKGTHIDPILNNNSDLVQKDPFKEIFLI